MGICKCRQGFEEMSWEGTQSGINQRGGMCRLPHGTWKAKVAKVDVRSNLTFPYPHNETKTALSFSGGGARAAALTLGVMRALDSLGLLHQVDGLGSLSGSAFVTIPWTFANASLHTEDFLGEDTDPKDLTLAFLDNYTCALSHNFKGTSMFDDPKLVLTKALPSLVGNRGDMHQSWGNMMTSHMLAPWELDNKDCLIVATDAAEARIKATNTDLKDFCVHKPMPGRPKVNIFGATILARGGVSHTDGANFQISPDWIGTPAYVNTSLPRWSAANASGGRVTDAIVGGGFVETWAFGGAPPSNADGGEQELPTPARPLSLGDVLAMTTYADFAGHPEFMPIYEYWPVGQRKAPEPLAHNESLLAHVAALLAPDGKAQRWQVADGGFVDETSLLPMLQRRAERITVFFFGAEQSFSDKVKWCDHNDGVKSGDFDVDAFDPRNAGMSGALASMCGYGYDDGKWHRLHNQVFKKEDLYDIACEMTKLREQGKPPVYKKRQQVQRNDYWGIQQYDAEIVYVINDKTLDFEEKLPAETQHQLRKEGGFEGFPANIKTDMFMKARELNLVAAMSEFWIRENAEMFKELYSK